MIRSIRFELVKMGCQKKNYIPLVGYLFFIILCYIGFRTSSHSLAKLLDGFEQNRAEAANYLDGFFFARIVLVPTFIVLMPIVMAALGGDCVAGERMLRAGAKTEA